MSEVSTFVVDEGIAECSDHPIRNAMYKMQIARCVDGRKEEYYIVYIDCNWEESDKVCPKCEQKSQRKIDFRRVVAVENHTTYQQILRTSNLFRRIAKFVREELKKTFECMFCDDNTSFEFLSDESGEVRYENVLWDVEEK